MPRDSEDRYMVATLIVATTTGLVLFFYILIFLNPFISINPFKPPRATPTLLIALPGLPPTWTPTALVSNSPTPISSPTAFPSATFVVPLAPTQPPVTATPPATATPLPTPRPTRTPLPTAAATSTASSPTPVPASTTYRTVFNCTHSGGTQIKGTVTSNSQPQYGVRVRLATSPDVATVVEEQFTRQQPDGSAGYAFVLKPIGSFDSATTWYLWLTDGTGTPISNPNFHFQTNSFGQDNPLACWLAIVDFVR